MTMLYTLYKLDVRSSIFVTDFMLHVSNLYVSLLFHPIVVFHGKQLPSYVNTNVLHTYVLRQRTFVKNITKL